MSEPEQNALIIDVDLSSKRDEDVSAVLPPQGRSPCSKLFSPNSLIILLFVLLLLAIAYGLTATAMYLSC
jgi:hypothetical protein